MTSNRLFHILPIGLNAAELRVLRSLSELSSLSERTRAYALCDKAHEQADIYLVNADDEVSLNAWRSANSQQPLPSLFLSTREITIDHYPVLRRPVIPARLLSTLNKLQIKPRDEAMTEEIEIHDIYPSSQMSVNALSGASQHAKAPGVRVLVANRSGKIRRQVAISLKPYWVSVEFAETADEVSRKLSASFYDLIFLDTEFADQDGIKLCKSIKADKLHANAPVIMLDRQASIYRRMLAALAKSDTYLPMPIRRSEFDDCLNKHLNMIRGAIDPYNSRSISITHQAA